MEIVNSGQVMSLFGQDSEAIEDLFNQLSLLCPVSHDKLFRFARSGITNLQIKTYNSDNIQKKSNVYHLKKNKKGRTSVAVHKSVNFILTYFNQSTL